MKRSLTLCIAVLMSLAVVPPHASGGTGCPNLKLCVWSGTNNTGTGLKIRGDVGVSNKIANYLNNQASSAHNLTGHAVYLYDRRNAEGDKVCIEPGDYVSDLQTFNDRASSSKVKSSDVCPA
jgi:hypothetical protein